MDLEDLAQDPEPSIDRDAWKIESEQDVYDLIEEGVLGYPQEYGYEEIEEFVRDVQDFLGVGELDEARQQEYREKWKKFFQRYCDAGGVFYNPENGDEYYTDDPDLLE